MEQPFTEIYVIQVVIFLEAYVTQAILYRCFLNQRIMLNALFAQQKNLKYTHHVYVFLTAAIFSPSSCRCNLLFGSHPREDSQIPSSTILLIPILSLDMTFLGSSGLLSCGQLASLYSFRHSNRMLYMESFIISLRGTDFSKKGVNWGCAIETNLMLCEHIFLIHLDTFS